MKFSCRCNRPAGNASYSQRIQKTVAQVDGKRISSLFLVGTGNNKSCQDNVLSCKIIFWDQESTLINETFLACLMAFSLYSNLEKTPVIPWPLLSPRLHLWPSQGYDTGTFFDLSRCCLWLILNLINKPCNIFSQTVRSKRCRRDSDDSGEAETERPDVDLYQLQVHETFPFQTRNIHSTLIYFQMNTLRRYKKHFKVTSRPGLNKALLADSLTR